MKNPYAPSNTIPSVILLIGLIVGLATAFWPDVSFGATPTVKGIPTTGKTADGKYPIYDLQGQLDDINYSTSKSIIYQPEDLPVRMKYIALKDVDAGYTCDFVCKDKAGHIVGLNPQRLPITPPKK